MTEQNRQEARRQALRDREYLRMISEQYPTVQAAATEIINIEAILRLPNGTEHFMSDLHGEYEAFCHIVNNCSGVIREKVERLYGQAMTKRERDEFATLIYYPQAIIAERKADKSDDTDWYLVQLHRLVEVCRSVASKYTRSKVRKALPAHFDYIIDELINMDRDDFDKEAYYGEIFTSIIELGRAEAFICAITDLIKRLAVDSLHIVGDVFDRGENPDKIMDLLIAHHNADIQWGNHDIQWMGAHLGNEASILSVVDLSLKYNNADLLEEGYGISLRKLSTFASEHIDDDVRFYPAGTEAASASEETRRLAKMRKAAFLMQLKAEGHIIGRRPEYDMESRNILCNIDFAKGEFFGAKLSDTSFPIVDPAHPLRFSAAEREVIEGLKRSFRSSEKLSRHIAFMMQHGSAYKVCNGNLIFHGCVPLEPDGSYMNFCGHEGRELMDYCEALVRRAYAAFRKGEEDTEALDFFWYLWCGRCSPLYGREKITTFERLYIDDPAYHKEQDNSYYVYCRNKEFCEKVLRDFGISGKYSHIVNGHVPVRTKLGENPVKAEGKLIVIDGGFCKAYHEKTGIAGYTLIYNSHGLRLCAHEPFDSIEKAIEQRSDIHSEVTVFETRENRLLVRDTDTGKELLDQLEGLQFLMENFRSKNVY